MSREKTGTREKILKAAWKLLEAEQTSDVRMSDIAEAAGISRQAVYLHFPARSELLIETTRYIDDVLDADGRLRESRNAGSGLARLDAFVEAWGNYIPEIHGVARALTALQETDTAAAEAWTDRMDAVRHGCRAAVRALRDDGVLAPEWSLRTATDCLWAMLSVGQWELLTRDCGWSQRRYVETMKSMARKVLTVAV